MYSSHPLPNSPIGASSGKRRTAFSRANPRSEKRFYLRLHLQTRKGIHPASQVDRMQRIYPASFRIPVYRLGGSLSSTGSHHRIKEHTTHTQLCVQT